MAEYNGFREYCERTTSQCMQYFIMKRRHFIEKTFWILVFLLMLLFTTTALNSSIASWIHSPTILFIENTETSVEEIPFPTITICPSNQLRKSIWKTYKNINTSNWEDVQHYRSLICTSHVYTIKSKFKNTKYSNYEKIKNVVNLKDFMISCPDLLQPTAIWQNTTIKNICDLVQPVMGLVGLCYSINLLPLNDMLQNEHFQRYSNFFSNAITFNYSKRSEWNLDYGYSNHNFLDVYPLRSSGVSYYNRLSLKLNAINDEFLECPNRAFKDGNMMLLITSPYEFPLLKSRSYIIPDTSTKIQITPVVKKLDSSLKWRSPEVRKCYLYNERKLFYFEHYSELNCYQECYMNKTISLCGCIIFIWTYVMSNEVKICGSLKNDCVKKAVVEVNLPKTRAECNCLPNCNMIRYDVTESFHNNDKDYLKITKLEKSLGAIVEFVFKHSYYTAYKAESIINTYSLISTVGGILGLFLGLNILNIFEMLYIIMKMFTVYIICTFKRLSFLIKNI